MIMFGLWLALTVMFAAELLNPGLSSSYPLDGYVSTGIGRLEAARLVARGERPGKARPPGELLPLDLVDLRLTNYPHLTLPAPDPAFTDRVKQLLGANVSRYGIAVLDQSNAELLTPDCRRQSLALQGLLEFMLKATVKTLS